MAKTKTEIKTFKLNGTKDGVITVAHITEPYGENSEAIVSIGVSLSGDKDNPEWKVHLPYENIDELIDALQSAKEQFKK
jgi:hypothetical protein